MTKNTTSNTQYVVHSYEDVCPHIRILRLQVDHDNHAISYQPGQYITMNLAQAGYPHAQDDYHMHPRPFSLASRPQDPYLEFYIARSHHSETARTGLRGYLTHYICIGQKIQINGPFGSAIFPDAFMAQKDIATPPIITIAGGSGIAGVKAALRDYLPQQHKSEQNNAPVHLYYGMKRASDFFDWRDMADLINQYPHFHPHIVFEEMPDIENHPHLSQFSIHHGMITDILSQNISGQDLSTHYGAMSGPPGLLSACLPLLLDAGLPPTSLHVDPDLLSPQDRARLTATP